jgi:subtilase family serine protease
MKIWKLGALALATAVGLAGAVGPNVASAQSARAVERSGHTFHVAVCPRGNPAGTARCFAHQVVDARGNPVNGKANPAATPAGYGPSQLRAAYGLTGVAGSGTPTVAIVDAYAYPRAEADLAVYRSQYGLPPCTTASGCLKIVGQTGGKPPSRVDTGWDQEQALDLDMVSAACPNCHILLVQASSASFSNLWTGVDYAKTQAGVRAISNSYGNTDSSSYAAYDSHYAGNNIAVTVSTGDYGYGAQWPATAPGAVAVGGTSLTAGGGTRGWTETVWNGAGSGCGLGHAKPSWQNGVTDACGGRMEADVSSNADPNTGVAVYGPATRSTSSWGIWGGTSESSPFIAGLFALRNGSINAASSIYSHTGNLNDVTSGSNGSCAVAYYCKGQVGYDGPTGLGTPNGIGAFSN